MEPAVPSQAEDWRPDLRRKLTWLLIAKLGLLVLLWAVCFSPSHRSSVDVTTAGRRWSLSPGPQVPEPADRSAPDTQEMNP